MDIFKDIYKISKWYVNFRLQDVFLEISNIKMYFRYIFARLKNHKVDIREIFYLVCTQNNGKNTKMPLHSWFTELSIKYHKKIFYGVVWR